MVPNVLYWRTIGAFPLDTSHNARARANVAAWISDAVVAHMAGAMLACDCARHHFDLQHGGRRLITWISDAVVTHMATEGG